MPVLGICSILVASVSSSKVKDTEFEERYTRNIKGCQVLVPRKIDQDGAFLSYSLPHFYERDMRMRRKRKSPNDSDIVHYDLTFNGKSHQVEMWPNHDFMSPGLVIEERGPDAALDLNKVKLRPVKSTQCHYTGRVKGHNGSRLALSVCDGLSGYIKTNQGHYFIEPMKGQQPQADGQHVHVVYKRSEASAGACGTGWEDGWRERLRWEHRRVRGAHTDMKADATLSINSKHWYLEVLVVADKRFLDYYNNTDAETYILTIMNMATDYFHDASVGNLLDIVVVRIIYLHKQEEELDLHINQDADASLSSFCKWQTTVNPRDVAHPNHHDIAVLLTRFDICTDNMSDCGLLGLAYTAQACNPNMSCAICEDTGMVLGVTVAHEIGHLMGCGHDDGVQSDCMPMADDVNNYVMAPDVQMATSRWSSCSRKFMQEFLDNGLGDCLLDEPQDHNFRLPQMPPGAMYDADFQCAQEFQSPDIVSCDMGPETNCKALHCEYKPKKCASYKQPPAEGTRCAANMWCYDQKCVPTGQRPHARNGEWGAWGPWSTCSRTCGGGVSFKERDCNDPAPLNRGRYCLGERRQYRLCNSNPCDPEATNFREQQCSQHDDDEQHWTPFLSTEPQNMCKLQCKNDAGMIKTVAPRVKDGTSCRPGTKDLCIAGQCRVVGCDWVLGSDAVDDRCGVCKGNGTECVIVEETFKGTGSGYVKIATIPSGSRKISIEELKPSANTLALGAEDGKTFYLNGDYNEESDRHLHVAGTVGYYLHPEEDLEKIVIAGPTTSNLLLYACFFGDPNPGIRYKYAMHSDKQNSGYVPRYHWEFVDWNECNRRCGGGTQESEPKCVQETDGTVSSSFCQLADKPKAMSRPCNQQPCKARWSVSEWGECSGCLFKTGHRTRTVQCSRESPNQDQEIITNDTECTEKKPRNRELCNNIRPCKNYTAQISLPERPKQTAGRNLLRKSQCKKTRPRIHVSAEGRTLGWPERINKRYNASREMQREGKIVKDAIPRQMFQMVEVPVQETTKERALSEEMSEALGYEIAETVDTKGRKCYKGKEAQKQINTKQSKSAPRA
jgi:hypothetical protein